MRSGDPVAAAVVTSARPVGLASRLEPLECSLQVAHTAAEMVNFLVGELPVVTGGVAELLYTVDHRRLLHHSTICCRHRACHFAVVAYLLHHPVLLVSPLRCLRMDVLMLAWLSSVC